MGKIERELPGGVSALDKIVKDAMFCSATAAEFPWLQQAAMGDLSVLSPQRMAWMSDEGKVSALRAAATAGFTEALSTLLDNDGIRALIDGIDGKRPSGRFLLNPNSKPRPKPKPQTQTPSSNPSKR